MSNKIDFLLTGEVKNIDLINRNLIYRGGKLSLTGCNMVDCTVSIEGKASEGVDFMKALFNAGAKCTVMKTFLTDEEYEKVKSVLGWEGVDGN